MTRQVGELKGGEVDKQSHHHILLIEFISGIIAIGSTLGEKRYESRFGLRPYLPQA